MPAAILVLEMQISKIWACKFPREQKCEQLVVAVKLKARGNLVAVGKAVKYDNEVKMMQMLDSRRVRYKRALSRMGSHE